MHNGSILRTMSQQSNQGNGGSTGNGGTASPATPNPTVDFHYIKGPDFRTVHIDGAIGGITPSGFLHIAMYCERSTIPKTITHTILPDGTLGSAIKHKGKKGIARQMEIDIIVNEATAKSLKIWLDQKLGEFENRRSRIRRGD